MQINDRVTEKGRKIGVVRVEGQGLTEAGGGLIGIQLVHFLGGFKSGCLALGCCTPAQLV